MYILGLDPAGGNVHIYISLGGFISKARLCIFIMNTLMTMNVLAYLHFPSNVDWERWLVLLQTH